MGDTTAQNEFILKASGFICEYRVYIIIPKNPNIYNFKRLYFVTRAVTIIKMFSVFAFSIQF